MAATTMTKEKHFKFAAPLEVTAGGMSFVARSKEFNSHEENRNASNCGWRGDIPSDGDTSCGGSGALAMWPACEKRAAGCQRAARRQGTRQVAK